MSRLTDDPNDPELTHGPDDEPTAQAPAYLVLSEEERAKGFVRPVRRSYIHVGIGGSEIDLRRRTQHGRTGDACGTETTMSPALAETYARDPHFYGSTYCCGCWKHLPVAEFIWAADGEVVGS